MKMAMAYHPVGFPNKPRLALLLLTITFTLQFTRVISRDALSQGDELAIGHILMSPRGEFVLSFSDGQIKYLKLSIDNINSGVLDVWIANPNNPIDEGSNPRLVLDDYGNLTIVYDKSDSSEFIPIFTSGLAQKINATAQLMDYGDFTVKELNEHGDEKRFLWRSFDYPNSVLLLGMRLGINNKTGQKLSLTAGSFTLGVDPINRQQLVMWRKGRVYWTSGPLKDNRFSNMKATPGRFVVSFQYSSNENETFFYYFDKAFLFSYQLTYIALSPEGYLFGEATVFCNGSNPMFDSGCVRPGPGEPKSKVDMRKILILSVAGGVLTILVSSYICYALGAKHRITALEKHKQKQFLNEIGGIEISSIVNGKGKSIKKERTSHDMQIFSFSSIVMATNNFSSANKLGEGGFGPVYKGKLLDGQEIAIKRLSEISRQGVIEFKNEVKLIAKLQHMNLVRLHGFCIEREERMLIYEYMPNKSLDFHLFDSNNRIMLDWKKRYDIIQGIAQGLVYLHKYSRLKIVHRDLKPSNILLDSEMNPKISDFGMAKLFGVKESEEKTRRVVGTYGYMFPEYAMSGMVSTKIDVFSFGVILLEIISGKRNNNCCHSDVPYSIVEYAWKLWKKGKALRLIDPMLVEVADKHNKILRCIHIGLLCLQHEAKHRPTMLDVVASLSNEGISLDEPKRPAYIMNIGWNEKPKKSQNGQEVNSINHVTLSTMSAR